MTIPAERPRVRRNKLSNELLGMSLFLASEIMIFSGLIAGYMILRSQFINWPPVGQPRLPTEMTAFNSLFLLASGYTAYRWRGALASQGALLRWIGATFIFGATFLVLQGREWEQLLAYGLSTTQDVYGGLFYVLVGAHAAHVAVALLVLARSVVLAFLGRYTPASHQGLLAVRLYWFFVVGIWPVIYTVVYLW